MASEALEAIVGTAPTFERTGMYTTIDVYAAGTAALYWGPSREEEEMHMMEEQRRMESMREIESAITAQYSDAPQAPQWSLDQPSYGAVNYSFGPDIGLEPMQSHDTGWSFTTHIEPEPVTSMGELNNWKSSQIPEPEPTIYSLHIDGVDYSQLINSLPEPKSLPSPGGMGWGFETKIELPIAPIDPLRGIDHGGMPDTNLNLKSYLEDTHYGLSEKPYIPTTRPTWDTDIMPKPEPVDYTSPVSNIMNRIGMPELDLKPKSYLPPSLGHLPGMNHVPEPDTGFQLYGLNGNSPLMAEKEAKRMLAGWETKKMLEEMEKPLAFLQLGINSLPESKPETPSGFIRYQDPTRTMLDIMEKTRHGSVLGLDSEPKSYLPPSLRHQFDMLLVPKSEPEDTPPVRDIMKDRFTVPKSDFSGYMNSVPEPEPDTLSGFIPYQDPTLTMLDMMEKTRHGSVLGLDSEPKSYLSSLKNQLSMHLMPEPEPDDTPTVMDIMKVIAPKFDFSGYMNTVPEPEPDTLSGFIPYQDPTIQTMLDLMEKTRHDSVLGLDSEPKSYLASLKHQFGMHLMPEPEPDDTPAVMNIMEDRFTVPKFDFSGYMNSVPEQEPVTPVRPILPFMEDAKPSVQEIMDSLKSQEVNLIEPVLPPQISFGLSRKTSLIREDGMPPLVRVDREAHHGKPENHLQYGHSLYTGRSGDEAYNLLSELYMNSKLPIRLPGEDED